SLQRFDIELSRDQIKNHKAKLRNLYINFKFLCEQSGFGWDPEKNIVTADLATWNELIESHPRRGFGKIRNKEFTLYDLAHQALCGTYATGKMADEEDVPDLNNIPVANITPVNRAKTTVASKPLAKRPAIRDGPMGPGYPCRTRVPGRFF
ncbi:hypothetical protein PTTG_30371, partial [Puccinia triticina 1-1 BBBD Race 1]